MNIILALVLTCLAVAFWRAAIRIVVIVVVFLIILGATQVVSLVQDGVPDAPGPSTETHPTRTA